MKNLRGYDFLVAHNPQPGSKLPFLLRLPLADAPIWLKAAQAWPHTTRVYCHTADCPESDADLEVLQRVPVVSCERRGSAIDLILSRRQNKRSQFVFTFSHGRPLIFWQTATSVRNAPPGLRIPGGLAPVALTIYVDSRERFGYGFSAHNCCTQRRALPVGDYAAVVGDETVAIIERKTLGDFIRSLIDGSLNFRMAELASVGTAAVVVEGSYAAILRYPHTGAGFLSEQLARLLVRYSSVPIHFLESRKIAEEWAYRYFAQICGEHVPR